MRKRLSLLATAAATALMIGGSMVAAHPAAGAVSNPATSDPATMSRLLAHRMSRRFAVILAVLAATVLPVSPAHATYGPQNSTVHIQLFSSSGTTVGKVTGTVEFDSGNTMFRYTLTMCRQSSYTAPWADLYVNGAAYRQLADGWVYGTTTCGTGPVAVHSAEVPYGAVVTNVRVNLHGASFGFPEGFREHQGNSLKDNPYN
jgi:hypothetical protein